MISKNWIRRRWMDGRTGHTVYLILIVTLGNFLLISYRLLIEQDPVFEELIPNLWLFGVIFAILYFPVSVIIGRWHNLTQVKIETTIKVSNQPLAAKMFRILLDVQSGKASKEEIEQARKMMKEIETSSN